MERSALIIASFFSIVNIGLSLSIACPDSKQLHPCTCKPMAYGLHVVCADFTDSQALINAFNILRDYNVKNVLLHNLTLRDVLPKDLFDDVKIIELGIELSNLSFSQPAFKGLDDCLHKLNIAKYSVIKTCDHFAIARLTNLIELSIKKNPLVTVKNEWLNGKTPNVETIVLDENEITNIENKAFADLLLLKSISIAENRIKEIKRSMFPKPAKYLKVIDLSGNEIQFLPEDFFSEMDSLVEIVLSGNDLTTLPEITWGKVWSRLKVVVLFDNNLICDRKLSWMTKNKWPRQVDGKCVAPSELVGKDLKEVYDTT